jgi:hypothetical protein
MAKWFRKTFVALLLVLVAYLLTVQVLRWIAFGEEERAALALMEPLPPPPAGTSGYKYLGLAHLDIPLDGLDAALARDLAAFGEWHAGAGARMNLSGEQEETWASPLAAEFPARPPLAAPDGACGLREADCLAKLRGNEAAIRAWLQAEAARLDLATRALASDHLANPYPPAADAPLAGFQLLRLPINAIAVQALDGDLPGALDRACGLLAAERRFLAQDGMLIDKMIHGVVSESAAGLVLAIRRADPAAPMPPACEAALAPVAAADYLTCGAFKHEYAMVAGISRQLDEHTRGGFNPRDWLVRSALIDERLMRGWSAGNFAPMCSEEGTAAILAGEVPVAGVPEIDYASVDYWAAPISRILASIAAPAYHQYQDRLLDHAASLRLHRAAVFAVGGELPVAAVPEAAASPGYAIRVDDGHWVLLLRRPPGEALAEQRIAIPE